MEEISQLINSTKNTVYTYFAYIVNVVTGLGLSVILARNLTVTEFGEFSFLVSTISVLAVLTSLGLDSTLQRYVAEYLVTKDKHKIKLLIRYTSLLRLTSITFVSIIILLFYNQIQMMFNLTMTYYDLIIFLLILFMNRFRSLVGTSLLNGYLKVYYDKRNFVIYNVSKLILFYVILQNNFGFKQLLLAWLVVETISLSIYLYNAFFALKETQASDRNDKLDANEIKRLSAFSKTQALAMIMFVFADIAVDSMMLGYFVDQSAVARYSLAMSIVIMIAKINPVALMKPLFSTIAVKKYTEDNSMADLKFQYIVLNKLTLVFCLPIFLILALHIDFIVNILYGVKYRDILPIIYVGMMFFIFRELIHPVNPVINALEKNKLFLVGSIFSFYNFVGNIVLIPVWGEFGALLSTGSAGIFLLIFYYFNLKRLFSDLLFPWESCIKVTLLLLPVITIHLTLISVLDGMLGRFFLLLVEVFTFIVTLTLFKYFSPSERNMLNSHVGKGLIWF